MPREMEFKIILELPIEREKFGGVVGNRVSVRAGEAGVSCLITQIAYLEKGKGARVRYLEHETPVVFAEEGSYKAARLKSLQEIDGPGSKVLLELDIICEAENQSSLGRGAN